MRNEKLKSVSFPLLFFLVAGIIEIHAVCPGRSQCTTGSCCLRCQFTPQGTLCRKEKSACDKPEYCTGKTRNCPRDEFLPDGTLCAGGRRKCYQGVCLKWQQRDGITRTNKSNSLRKVTGFIGKNRIPRKATLNQGQNNSAVLIESKEMKRNTLFVPVVCACALFAVVLVTSMRTMFWYCLERRTRKKLESNIIHFALK